MTPRNVHQSRRVPRPSPSGPRRRGMVLFVVVIFVAMVSLAGLSYVAVMSMEHKAVRLRGEELQVEMAIGSGIEAIRAHLTQSAANTRSARFRDDPQRRFRGVVVADDSAGGRRTRFSVVSPQVANDQMTGLRFGLSNESARLNLAVLIEWERLRPGAAREALLNLPEMSPSIADAILDWIDPDSDPRASGAEASYYSGLGVPYGPRNAEPTSLEELLLVRDVTRGLLFGADENLNYRIDSGEQAGAGGRVLSTAGATSTPWAMLLTVFSAEKNLTPDGKPKIDLNERDLRSLHGKLAQVIDSDLAAFIILCRQHRQVRLDATAEQGVPVRSATLDLSVPARYQFTSPLDLLGIAVEVPAGPRSTAPRMVASPLAATGRAVREALPALLDYASVGTEAVIRGRVNLMEAPQSVLMAVPGMTEGLARRIESQGRVMARSADAARRQPTWLLAEGLVNLEQMKAMLPFVTCGGDVYRAQVVGFFDDGGPVGRAEVVIDATSDPPRQVYYKDLRLLGRGFSIDELRGTTAGVPAPLEAPKALEAPEWPLG